jgi:general secretion pathway protein E
VLDEQSRNLLTFDTGYKSKFIDYLRRQGYEVFEKAKVGSMSGSGATHVLDLLARRDDGFLSFILGIGIAIGNDNEEIGLEAVFRFDNKVYDLGIHDKILLAVPGLNNEARQFAQRQRIKSFNARELDAFLSGVGESPARPVIQLPFTYESRTHLLKYLHDQGYRTEEKAKIRGRSGAEYTMDIIAYFDDGLFTHTISVGILTDPDGVGLEAVSAYDTKAYDIGIHDKVLLVAPALAKEVRQFADQQKIKIIEVGNASALV